MPAKSKQQQKFMGMVHALNKGDIKPSDVSKSVKDVAKNIKKSDAEDFASTKHSGLPRKVKEQILNAFKEYANKMSGNKHGGSGSYGYAPQKGLRDDDGYTNEATLSQIHKAVKKGSYPVTIVATMLGKVVKQELVKTPQAVPAAFRMMQGGYPRASVAVEDKTGKILFKESINEGMFSTIDQIRQDSKDVRDFVKKVFADRDFKDMKNDKEFLKYLKSIYEGVDESKGVPQNYMQGRTSDYHTALRGKNRDYSGGTNFKKTNHGQPDLENDDEDQETNQLSVQQTKLKEEMGKLSSSERIELYKLYSKAMKAMPGSPNQKKIKILINKLRKKADLKPLPINEAKLDHHRISGNSIELLVRHNRQKYAIKFKDKRILDKMGFDWSKPKNIEKLLSLKKFPKGMSVSRSFHEYGQRLDLSYLEDEEARLDGTPKPKDAIDRDIDEYSGGSYEYTKGDQYGQNSVDEGTMIRLAGQIAQELLPKDTWSRYSNDGRKNKEFVKSVVKDLAQTLNRFYKSHNISVKIKENKIELNEIGVFDIKNYVKGIIPSSFFNTTTRDKKEKLNSTLRDLKSTLNQFWKQHKIPYRIK